MSHGTKHFSQKEREREMHTLDKEPKSSKALTKSKTTLPSKERKKRRRRRRRSCITCAYAGHI
jgi:hypothetical protein